LHTAKCFRLLPRGDLRVVVRQDHPVAGRCLTLRLVRLRTSQQSTKAFNQCHSRRTGNSGVQYKNLCNTALAPDETTTYAVDFTAQTRQTLHSST
jgi:hypothetical protein